MKFVEEKAKVNDRNNKKLIEVTKYNIAILWKNIEQQKKGNHSKNKQQTLVKNKPKDVLKVSVKKLKKKKKKQHKTIHKR